MFPIIPANSVTAASGNDEGIFGYGSHAGASYTAATNLVSNTGVVASDQAATTGTVRQSLAGTQYGGDKGIFGFGEPGPIAVTNKVSNTGVVASDTAGVGTARNTLAACSYGDDKGIFGFGNTGSATAVTNLVSDAGVVASDQAATTGTARYGLSACEYGGDKGIFGFGTTYSTAGIGSITNLVSNAGVVASDQAATTGTVKWDWRHVLMVAIKASLVMVRMLVVNFQKPI